MKVLHLNTNQEGGAALCAMRLHKALLVQGVESKMLFAEGESLPDDVDGAIAKKDLSIRIQKLSLFHKVATIFSYLPWYKSVRKYDRILRIVNRSGLLLNHPYSGYKSIVNHPLVKWADIIHLHWVPGFVDYPTFFKNINKPIVWTLHDKYPMVGTMHYSSKYFPVPDSLSKFDNYCAIIKRNGILKSKKLHVVAISQTVKMECNDSDILKGIPCHLINNGIDATIFQPYNVRRTFLNSYLKSQLFKITDNTIVFLFVSHWISDKNKGVDRIVVALNKIKHEDIALIVVGRQLAALELQPSFPILYTGAVNNELELAKLYSLSNFFVSASYEETFGQTITEALACGCPVIATPTGVAPEIIDSSNGVLANGYDSEDIAEAIELAMKKEYDSKTIRESIVQRFSSDVIAKKYKNLYTQLS